MGYNALLCAASNAEANYELFISILAFLASLVAIIISVISLHQNKKLNTTNLQARYFEKIFTLYVVERIPNDIEKVRFVNGKLHKDYKDINNTMMDMIEDSKYFAYAKHGFYIKLKQSTIALEDKLIECASDTILDMDQQLQFIYEIHEDIQAIIKLINKNYHSF